MLNKVPLRHNVHWASQMAQVVKNICLQQEVQNTWVQSCVQEDPLEEGSA